MQSSTWLELFLSLCWYQERNKHFEVWHGKHHHHFRQSAKLHQSSDNELEHKTDFQTSHPKGSVLAPMAGLVVKVLPQNGAFVEEGQPILVLEAMKMEVKTIYSFIYSYVQSVSLLNHITLFFGGGECFSARRQISPCRLLKWSSSFCRPTSLRHHCAV